MNAEKITQKELAEKLSKNKKLYVGVTTCPPCREKSRQYTDQRKIKYVAETTNMRLAENKLLKQNPKNNIQKQSNAQEKRGWVYLA